MKFGFIRNTAHTRHKRYHSRGLCYHDIGNNSKNITLNQFKFQDIINILNTQIKHFDVMEPECLESKIFFGATTE